MNSSKPSSPVSGGPDFEAYVASLYDVLGYRVRTNVPLGGQQVNVLVEKHLEGVGLTRILVECKYKTSGSVSNQDVFDTISAYQSLMIPHAISHCAIVTNTQFSQAAQTAVGNNPLFKLVELASLENDLLNLKDSFLGLKRSYEAERIYNEFVIQTANVCLPYTKEASHFPNVIGAINTWIAGFGDGIFVDDADDRSPLGERGFILKEGLIFVSRRRVTASPRTRATFVDAMERKLKPVNQSLLFALRQKYPPLFCE